MAVINIAGLIVNQYADESQSGGIHPKLIEYFSTHKDNIDDIDFLSHLDGALTVLMGMVAGGNIGVDIIASIEMAVSGALQESGMEFDEAQSFIKELEK